MLKASTMGEPGFVAAAVSVEAGHAFGRPCRGLRLRQPAGRMRTMVEGNLERAGESLVRRVNGMIRERSPFGYVPFFCECGPGCFHTVWLDALDYDEVVSVPDAAVLASGHGRSGIAESTEEASSRLSAAYRPLTSAVEAEASPAGLDCLVGVS